MTMTQIKSRQKFSLRFLLLGMTLICCIGCDQYTKKMAINHLTNVPVQTFWDDTVRIMHVKNPGGFLGMGGTMTPEKRFWIFSVSNGLLLCGISLFLWKKWDMPLLSFFALTLFLAGGIGNQIDRLMQQGFVTDFLNLGIGSVRTGIFNIADIAITVGILLLCWTWIKEGSTTNQVQPS